MRVTVEFYGGLRELAGAECLALDMPGETVGDALGELCRHKPALREQLPRIACAIGDHLVQRGDTLHEGSVLALIPPVSGGSA